MVQVRFAQVAFSLVCPVVCAGLSIRADEADEPHQGAAQSQNGVVNVSDLPAPPGVLDLPPVPKLSNRTGGEAGTNAGVGPEHTAQKLPVPAKNGNKDSARASTSASFNHAPATAKRGTKRPRAATVPAPASAKRARSQAPANVGDASGYVVGGCDDSFQDLFKSAQTKTMTIDERSVVLHYVVIRYKPSPDQPFSMYFGWFDLSTKMKQSGGSLFLNDKFPGGPILYRGNFKKDKFHGRGEFENITYHKGGGDDDPIEDYFLLRQHTNQITLQYALIRYKPSSQFSMYAGWFDPVTKMRQDWGDLYFSPLYTSGGPAVYHGKCKNNQLDGQGQFDLFDGDTFEAEFEAGRAVRNFRWRSTQFNADVCRPADLSRIPNGVEPFFIRSGCGKYVYGIVGYRIILKTDARVLDLQGQSGTLPDKSYILKLQNI